MDFFALFANFYGSAFFSAVKFFLGIYIAILIVDIILILIFKGLGADIRKAIKGMKMPAIPKGRMQKKWAKIKDKLASGNVSQYKVAILEADVVIDKVLSDMGFGGKNVSERLEKIKPIQLYNYEEIKKAHLVRNRIIHEADFEIDKKQAEEVLEIFESLLKHLELF